MSYDYLVVSDMDYTLLMTGKEISEENKRAVKALSDNNIAFSLATGRCPFMIGKYIDELNLNVPIICSNGAVLYDPKTESNLYSADIPFAKVKDIIIPLLERGLDVTGYSDKGIYLSENNSRRDFFANYNRNLPQNRKAVLKEFKDTNLTPDGPSFNKILIINCPDDVSAKLNKDADLEIEKSAATFTDIMLKGQTKGKTLMKLADILTISHENTFALGDSDNDLSMIKESGTGIAMQNSVPEILRCADIVTSSCEDNGFAKAVYDIIIPKCNS